MLKMLEHVPTLPTIRLGMKFRLLTMVRKSELLFAVWEEVDFENAVLAADICRLHPGFRLAQYPDDLFLSEP